MAVKKKRSLSEMSATAQTSQKDLVIEELKTQIRELTLDSQHISGELLLKDIVPLRLPGKIAQPRRYFDEGKLSKLTESIGKLGVLEPIVVRQAKDGLYEVLSGERRWRCCVALEKETIPYRLIEADDNRALEIALLAHLLGENISSIEETDSIMSLLILKLCMPFEEVKVFLHAISNFRSKGTTSAALTGREELIDTAEAILEEFDLKIGSFVNNRIPLLAMPEHILNAVREGKINPTNAQIICKQPESWHQELLTHGKLSKRELTALIQRMKAENLKKTSASDASSSVVNTHFEDTPIEERIFSDLSAIKGRKEALHNRKVQIRMKRIEKELQEIRAILADDGISF